MSNSDETLDRNSFLNLAGVFQGGMVVVALGLAWGLHVDPWDYVAWNARAWIIAAMAVLPLCGLSLLLEQLPFTWARTLRVFWTKTLRAPLLQCSWLDLVLLTLLVGVSEELLFRGVLQVWLARWSFAGALLITNLMFAAAHPITPAYAIIAGIVGLYLSGVMLLTEPPNLLVPILCHAGCDLFAFWRIRGMEQRG